MNRFITNSAEETEQLGERIASKLKGMEVIALFGGFFDYLDTGVLVIEWSENIEGALPENALRITISRGESDNQRIFDIEGVTLEDIGG